MKMVEDDLVTELLQEFHAIVQSIAARTDSFAFREPVDWKGMQLHDYREIIKKPMDLGTLRLNIENKKYLSLQEAVQDMKLIWDNCKLYNGAGSEFYALADKLSVISDEYCTALMNLESSKRDRNRMPTSEERLRLSYDIFKINSIDLGRVLAMVEISCPDALSYKQSTEEVLLNFEGIEASCFHDINIYAMECLLERKDRRRKPVQNAALDCSDSTRAGLAGAGDGARPGPGRGRKRKKLRSGSDLSGGSSGICSSISNASNA